MMIFNFSLNNHAYGAQDYEIYKDISGSINYRKNGDGRNTITLINCRARKRIDIVSPTNTPVTRVESNFAGGANPSKMSAIEVMKVFAKNTGIFLKGTTIGGAYILANILKTLGHGAAFIVKNAGKALINGLVIGVVCLTPFVNIFMMAAVGNSRDRGGEGMDMIRVFKSDQYSKYEPNYYKLKDFPDFNYFKLSKSAKNIYSADLPECLALGECAFSNCEMLQKINLPKCKEFGNSVFSNCKSLENVRLQSCVDLPYGAFEDCKNLKRMDLDNCEVMSGSCFKNCEKLDYVYAPNCKRIEKGAFDGCSALRELVVSKDCKFAENVIPKEKVKSGIIKFYSDDGSGRLVSMLLDEFESSIIGKGENNIVFDEIDSESGVRVYADRGVFSKGDKLLVKKVTLKDVASAEEYKNLLEKLDDKYKSQVEKMCAYDIKVIDENGKFIQPNGMAKLMFPIDESMNEKDLKALRVSEGKDSDFGYEITEIDGKKYCCYYVDHFSFYCLIDTLSVEDVWEYLIPYITGLAALTLAAWWIYSVLKKKKSYSN